MKKPRQPVTKGVASVPVITQLEAMECGAACLCMILAYYGKWVPLEVVRRDCGVTWEGSSAAGIMDAAEAYGMDTEAYRIKPEMLRKQGTFPCIIHWKQNHFVVCDGFRGNWVYLNDPAKGSCCVPMEEFEECFSGVVLAMAPGGHFVPGGKPKSISSFIRKRLQGRRPALAFAALAAAGSALAGILSAGLSRVFLDRMLNGGESAWVGPFMAAMGAVTGISLLSAWMRAIGSIALKGQMAAAGSTAFMQKLLRLPMGFFSLRRAGDIRKRLQSNETIAEQIADTIVPLCLNTAVLVFYLTAMIHYSGILTLIGVGSVLLQVLVSNLVSQRRDNLARKITRDSSRLSSATMSVMNMRDTIRASGAENGYFEWWAGYQAAACGVNKRVQEQNVYLELISAAITSLTGAAVLILGVWLTMHGRFTIGMIMAFQGLLSFLMNPACLLSGTDRKLHEMRIAMERVEDVMAYPEDTVPEHPAVRQELKGITRLSGGLEMRDVAFGYSREQPPLIEHFCLKVRPGQTVAITGASGCGKSTLARLLSGMVQPWSGEILYDGIPLREIDRETFTGSVGVTDPNLMLFDDTIANNIRMWDDTIEDSDVIRAAVDAKIHNSIMSRKEGYGYRMTEDGRNLSEGERQRIDIARVLARNPAVIIMDEAASALDIRTESEIMWAVRERGAACIVITGRVSAIRECDEIIVMDRGKISERGTHDQLMARDGAYKAMVNAEDIPDRSGGQTAAVSRDNRDSFSREAMASSRFSPQRKKNTGSLVLDLMRQASGAEWRRLILTALLAVAAGMVIPWLNRILFADVIGSGSEQMLRSTALFMVCAVAGVVLFSAVRDVLAVRVGSRLSTEAQAAVVMRILSLPPDFFRKYSAGEWSSRVEDVPKLCMETTGAILGTGLTAAFSLAYIIEMVIFAPSLTAPAVLVMILMLAAALMTVLARMRHCRRQILVSDRESRISRDIIAGMQKIHMTGSESRAFDRWFRAYAEKAALSYKPPFFLRISSVIPMTISLLGTLIIYSTAIRNGVGAASYYSFSTAWGSVSGALLSLTGMAETFAGILPVLEALRPVLEAPEESEDKKTAVTRLSGGIELNGITFRYKEADRPVLDGLNLRIRPGEYTAIVGGTASGKSTMLRIMLGLESPQRGVVSYDGHDLNEFDRRSLRRRIGTVLQDGKLLSADIYTNIVITAPWLTEQDAWTAAEQAGIAEDIRRLPLQMQTVLTEGGAGISGGQRQRLLMARALAAKPDILFLDEAFSTLDDVTLETILKTIGTLKCTRVIVSHRAAALRCCDRIVVLDGGKIAEDGTYDELMARNGVFARLGFSR